MKQTFKIFTLAAVCAGLALPTLLNAQDHHATGLYFKSDIGGNWMDDIEVNSFFGETLPANTQVKLDPGFRFGAAIGYQVTDWFAAEGEFGYTFNIIDSISGATRVDDASYGNLPVFVNAKLQLPNRSLLVPYIGAGVGFATSFFDADEIWIGDTHMTGSEAASAFAWQALAGLRFQINKNMSVGAEYRFIWTDEVEFEADSTSGTFTDEMEFGVSMTHAVSVVFQCHF